MITSREESSPRLRYNFIETCVPSKIEAWMREFTHYIIFTHYFPPPPPPSPSWQGTRQPTTCLIHCNSAKKCGKNGRESFLQEKRRRKFCFVGKEWRIILLFLALFSVRLLCQHYHLRVRVRVRVRLAVQLSLLPFNLFLGSCFISLMVAGSHTLVAGWLVGCLWEWSPERESGRTCRHIRAFYTLVQKSRRKYPWGGFHSYAMHGIVVVKLGMLSDWLIGWIVGKVAALEIE